MAQCKEYLDMVASCGKWMMSTTDGDMKVRRLVGRGGDGVMIWYDDHIVMAHADDFLITS